MIPLYLDTEVYSEVDVRKVGASRYAEDPSTDLVLCGTAIGDGPVSFEEPQLNYATMVYRHERIAWNARFDELIMKSPHIAGDDTDALNARYFDAAALSAMLTYPLKLEEAAKARGLVGKYDAGTRLINRYCSPQKATKTREAGRIDIFAEENAEDLEQFKLYCATDVFLLRDLYTYFEPAREHWEIHHRRNQELVDRMNQRGIPIDIDSVELAIREVNKLRYDLDNYAQERFGVGLNQTKVLKEKLIELGVTHGGEVLSGVGKEILEEVLRTQTLQPDAAHLIQLRLQFAKTSLGKLEAMKRSICRDGRVRDTFIYHGARTSRVTGRNIQPTNMKRSKTPAEYFEDLHRGMLSKREKPIEDTANAMRGFIKAPEGLVMAVADYASIEACILAAVARQEDLRQAFLQKRPVYEEFASLLFQIPVDTISKDSDERQFGKIGVLSCGYGVGGATLQEQARTTYSLEGGLDFFKYVVDLYRQTYWMVPEFWSDIEERAFSTLRGHPRHPFNLWGDFMVLELPSGRCLFYPDPLIIDTKRPWGQVLPSVTYMGQETMTRKWKRLATYGGKLTENLCQAIGADLIYHAMANVEALGFEPILQIYDEVVSLCAPDADMQAYEEALCDAPQWARDLGIPISAEAFTTERYTK